MTTRAATRMAVNIQGPPSGPLSTEATLLDVTKNLCHYYYEYINFSFSPKVTSLTWPQFPDNRVALLERENCPSIYMYHEWLFSVLPACRADDMPPGHRQWQLPSSFLKQLPQQPWAPTGFLLAPWTKEQENKSVLSDSGRTGSHITNRNIGSHIADATWCIAKQYLQKECPIPLL